MVEITLLDSNFPHQKYLTPFIDSTKIIWKRDSIRRKINVYTDNFIKKEVCEVPQDGNINVCLLLEPYTNPPWTDIYDYIKKDFEKFDLIITHNIDSLGEMIANRPDKFHYSTKCITTTWLTEDMIRLFDKTRFISMPFSYKNFSEGHRIRHIIYEKYKANNIIDFYGTGVPGYSGDFRDCFTEYKYTIVCENTLQYGFNSEKINDAFLTGCVPIYWGPRILDAGYDTSSIFYISPINSNIINFNFEESLLNLNNIINYLIDKNPYDELIYSIRHNHSYAKKFIQSEDNLYSILKTKGYVQ